VSHPPVGSLGPPTTTNTGTGLRDFLAVERVEEDLFRGWCHGGSPGRAMGGQVAAQALAAAGGTVGAQRTAHSLHGYFLRGGDPRVPFDYRVERTRDGRRYEARRVTVTQGGVAVFTLAASFKSPGDGPERQPAMPHVLPPEDLVDAWDVWAELNPDAHRQARYAHVTSMRVAPPPGDAIGRGAARGDVCQYVWFRATETFDDDPLLHACALTYCSDISLAQTATLDHDVIYPLRRGRAGLALASVDHAVWFHRPFRMDEWVLFAQRSPTAGDGRGFNLGEFWSQDGNLIASAAQESVLERLPGARSTSSGQA